MSYEKKTWENGSELTPDDLNKYEDFLFEHDNAITDRIDKSQIKNNLSETVIGNVLDATMGKALKELFDNHSQNNILHTQYIEGLEYLIYFHDKIRNVQNVKIICGGDSTTYGTSIVDNNYKIHALCKNILNKYGMPSVSSINAGHEGGKTWQWKETWLGEDMAQNPDLYILRYGLNDGGYSTEIRLEQFTNALRNGLTTLRASKPVDQLSIVLMMPNSCNDDTYGRNYEWLEEIYPVIRQAARDFQCCFVDTFHYLYDSTNVEWQDLVMGDTTTHVHPLETGNAWIASLLADVLMPVAFRNYGITNVQSTTLVKAVTDTPSAYPFGLSIYRTNTSFPFDGEVYTFRGADNILIQINSSYKSQTTESFAIRRGFAGTSGSGTIGSDAWAPWIVVGNTEAYEDLSLSNDWVYYGSKATPKFCKSTSGLVSVKGLVKSGTTTSGTVIATLPAGYRPLENSYIVVSCNGTFGLVELCSDGTIKCVNIGSNAWVDLGRINFIAEQ